MKAGVTTPRLRYVNDGEPGFTRRRAGKGFRLRRADGRAVSDHRIQQRVAGLVIPPAWTDVWICRDARGHIQATGRDARGRKQYVYHPAWREARDREKFNKIWAFARALPRIRARVTRDLRRPALPRERVLATIVKLLDKKHIRVGNEEYARTNGSFGLTTLRDRHVKRQAAGIEIAFNGKSGKSHNIQIDDRRLARIVKACQDLPGQRLFQYVHQGVPRPLTSNDVNRYLREIAGDDFTAKDFRTAAGTVLAATALCENTTNGVSPKHHVAQAVKAVALKLGNTPSVCRKCYIHPYVIESYVRGTLASQFPELVKRASRRGRNSLSPEEAATFAFLSKSQHSR